MSKIDEVRSEMMAAMKAHDKERKDALSALLTALKNKFIDKRADLTEEEENEVVLREIKLAKETIDTTPADRTDIIDECKARITVFEEFAPKMMDEAEIKAYIEEKFADVLATGNKGQIMKAVMGDLKGKADGKLINQVVAGYCK